MAMAVSGGWKFLSEDERALVARTRGEVLAELDKPALIALARSVREARRKARDRAAQQRREWRGKAPPRGVSPAVDDHGTQRKAEILVAAVKRINNAIRRLEDEAKRHPQARIAERALALKRAGADGQDHRPDPGRTPHHGMQKIESERPTVEPNPAEIGRVSQFVKDAQARRDS